MTAYYNENDPYAAQWLRNLIAAGHIAPGDVDERSILKLRAGDLDGYDQCHFFAGIGGWSVALRLAGWPDDRPVWTGSCPCQPFSAAGAGKAAYDERHLWPSWQFLIRERLPPIVFGEQVEAAIGWGWLDAVFASLEEEGYACGAAVLPACSVGAPHIRQRVWFVADANGGDAGAEGLQRGGEYGQRAQDGRPAGGMGNAAVGRGGALIGQPGTCSRPAQPNRGSGVSSFWSDAEWFECTDGRSRPVGPGAFPLGHGIQRRTSKLRAYGNAIVPQVAAEFIKAAVG